MRRLPTERVAGGTRVVVERDEDAMVLMTDDPAVVGSIRQRVARVGRQAVVLQRDLAAATAKMVPEAGPLVGELEAVNGPMLEAAPQARAEIGRANSQLAAGNIDGAYQAARSARRILDEAAQRQRRLLAAAPQLSSTPFDASLGSLDEWAEFQGRLAQLHAGENLLYGGDFEALGQLTQFGWQHISEPLPGMKPRAELSAVEPYLGQYSLQLSAVAVPAETAPQVVGRRLVWITTPPIHVAKGQVLEISGWVRVPDSIVGSIDGLTIVDSLGGEELALRVRSARDWQPFRMIRGVPASTDLTVTFALTGTGTALVDAVMIRPLARPNVRRLPSTTDSPPPADPRSAELPGPLFAPPARR
jgi:hypothetical protein